MMQRTFLFDKKKKRKNELDKAISGARNKVELDLKQQNKKSDNDYIDLDKLEPNNIRFAVSEDLKVLLNNVAKITNEYVTINNEYINVKNLEDKAKVTHI